MELIDHPHFYQWTILGLTLIVLTYAAFKIKNEPDQYEETSVKVKLQDFTLKIPSWWGMTFNNDSKLQFERTDTRYEWAVTFEVIENELDDPSARLSHLIDELKIKFDTGFDQENFKIGNVQIFRHEGMSTENGIKRVYMDVAIVKRTDNKKYLEVISRSSILNGCVEGPYVEKVLQNIEAE
jgi:hypothetical protein